MRKPSTRSDAQLVEQYIGTAYDVVKEVHDNLDSIETVADNLVHSLKYLGASPTPPDTRLDGSPIQDGDYYLDSNTSALVYYNEMTGFWAEVDPAEVLQAAEETKASEEAAALSAAEAKDNSTATASDREQTGLDVEATAADRNVTQADRAQTTADANQTSTDALNTALDSAATSEDRVVVNADRIQTNADRAASEAARIGAETAEQNATQAFDSFDDKYLGSKTEAPTVDNDGDPLQVGATYWHDNQDDTGSLQYWNGNEWEAPDKAASASAQAAQASAQAALTSEGIALTAQANASADAISTSNDAAAALGSKNAAELSEFNSAASEDAAKVSQDAAKVSEDAALISRNSASVSAGESAQSAIESEASAVRAEEAADVVTWKQYASKQVDMEREREANNNLFAASSFVQYGKHLSNSSAGITPIKEGLWAWTQEPTFANTLSMGRYNTSDGLGQSETPFAVTHVAGFVSELMFAQRGTATESVIKFPEAPDGTVTYNKTTGVVTKHATSAAAFAAVTADVEVVTERVDMFGGEFFLEEVTETNPYVYPKGMIQSQATTMNGVTTVRSNRPSTYYSVFDGDTDSTGIGVDLLSATDAEKQAICSDNHNNIHLTSDGKLVQWRMRQRTVAGAGNGDWSNVNPANDSALFYKTGSFVKPQGKQDSVVSFDPTALYLSTENTLDSLSEKSQGVFNLRNHSKNADVAVNGECYFHVWGTVPRLNQGVKHPFNDMGSAKATDGYWYQSSLIKSLTDCFTHNTGGDIASGVSGRHGGNLYHDGIGASGQGGVIDDRLSAYEVTLEDVSEAEAKLKNGSLRGMQKLPFTEVYFASLSGNANLSPQEDSTNNIQFNVLFKGEVGSTVVYIEQSDGTYNKYTPNADGTDGNLLVPTAQTKLQPIDRFEGQYIIMTFNTETSVEGNADNGFTVQDVIADPANIVQTQDLANGWLGGWVSSGIPETGVTQTWENTRKNIGAASTQAYWTDDNGVTWNVNETYPIGSSTNGRDAAFNTGLIYVIPYQATPYQTEQDENRPVLFGDKGVGDVSEIAHNATNWGSLLSESLIGKVCTSSASGTGGASHPITRLGFVRPDSTISESANDPTEHSPVTLPAPNNDSPAVKALVYPTSENQQVSLNVAYNELVWGTPTVVSQAHSATSWSAGTIYRVTSGDWAGVYLCNQSWSSSFQGATLVKHPNGNIERVGGTSGVEFTFLKGLSSWGDDSTVRITNGQGTYNNLNGDTCLYGSNRTTKKLGYTKNRSRAGEQTPGVDL